MGRQDGSILITSFRENYAELLKFLARRLGDTERAADVAQDIYLRLAAIPPAGTEILNPRAFIYRVASNLAVDALRREGRIAAHSGDSASGASVADPAPSPEIEILDRERLCLLDAALQELPQNARRALLMFRLDGLSHAEIARRLGVSESMVAKYIGRALRHCRDRLKDRK